MKIIVAAICAGALAAGAAVYAAQEPPEFPKPLKEHEWLRQLAGEWDSEAEISMDPTKPPMKHKGTESSRMIGGFWFFAENKGDVMGSPFTGLLTLGYNPEKKKYIGTWVDSMTSILWTYEGSVDAAGKKLTIEAVGPGMDGKPATFRESIEVKDKDHKEFTSSLERDGKWVIHLTIRYARKK
jgi:hypothetical protein